MNNANRFQHVLSAAALRAAALCVSTGQPGERTGRGFDRAQWCRDGTVLASNGEVLFVASTSATRDDDVSMYLQGIPGSCTQVAIDQAGCAFACYRNDNDGATGTRVAFSVEAPGAFMESAQALGKKVRERGKKALPARTIELSYRYLLLVCHVFREGSASLSMQFDGEHGAVVVTSQAMADAMLIIAPMGIGKGGRCG